MFILHVHQLRCKMCLHVCFPPATWQHAVLLLTSSLISVGRHNYTNCIVPLPFPIGQQSKYATQNVEFESSNDPGAADPKCSCACQLRDDQRRVDVYHRANS
eukprot:2197681-Amphidinium_carterae.2